VSNNPFSPRFLQHTESTQNLMRKEHRAKEEEKLKQRRGSDEDQKASRVLSTHADHVLHVITKTIRVRNPFVDWAKLGDIGEKENARPQLVESLKAVMDMYREANVECEKCKGFGSLCSRASMRLFSEKLIPDFEGWARCGEPSPVFQVEDELEDLLVTAAAAQELLKQRIASSAPWECGARISKPEGIPGAAYALDPGLKSEESARAKALIQYGPAAGKLCHRHLLDLSRLLLVFEKCDMLHAGLERILRTFEVVAVNNYFHNPGRLGVRYVEVLVIVHVTRGDEQIPHVCELRLEELSYNKRHEEAAALLEQVYDHFRKLTEKHGLNWPLNQYLIKTILAHTPTSPELRRFRCHFAKRYGSTTNGWRKELGDAMADFNKFKNACQKINLGYRATEFYQELDTSLGGCVNLFHLDPEPVALLIKLRARMFAFADLPTLQKSTTNKFAMEPAALFNMLTSHIKPQRKGQLSLLEFRLLSEPLNMDPSELEKAFTYLDSGVVGAAQACIFVSDIAWLMKLPKTVDEHAVSFNGDIADVGQRKTMTKQTVDATMPADAKFRASRAADVDFSVHRPADADDNCDDECASPPESPRAPSDEESTPRKVRAGPWKQKKRIQLRNSPPRSPRSPRTAARAMWTRRESDSHDCVCGFVISGDAHFCQKCGAKRLDPETEPPPNETCECGAVFAPEALFCQMCGSKRPGPEDEPPAETCQDSITCACGSTLPPDARFCPNCGQNQSEPSPAFFGGLKPSPAFFGGLKAPTQKESNFLEKEKELSEAQTIKKKGTSEDAVAGQPGKTSRSIRTFGKAVIAANRFAAAGRAVGTQGRTVEQKASEKVEQKVSEKVRIEQRASEKVEQKVSEKAIIEQRASEKVEQKVSEKVGVAKGMPSDALKQTDVTEHSEDVVGVEDESSFQEAQEPEEPEEPDEPEAEEANHQNDADVRQQRSSRGDEDANHQNDDEPELPLQAKPSETF